MILEDPGIIEEGLRILDAHLMAGRHGLIDLLGVDGCGSFVVLEIDRGNEAELLSRLHEHQSWVASQALFLRRLYATGPSNPFRPPRAMALSRRFSERFLQEIEELKQPVTLLHYRILFLQGLPALYLEPARDDEIPAPGPVSDSVESLPLEPERLTPEEWEAFYGFERRRLAVKPDEERVNR